MTSMTPKPSPPRPDDGTGQTPGETPESLRDLGMSLAAQWSLTLGESFTYRRSNTWMAPGTLPDGTGIVLKVAERHCEAEHEADGLQIWDGDGAVRLYASAVHGQMAGLVVERCSPGTPLSTLPEPDQDEVIARILRRIWIQPPSGHPFRPLREMCDQWIHEYELNNDTAIEGDNGLMHLGLSMFRDLSRSADQNVLLHTDLHAGNVLAAQREPWLLIDPKPYIGDPCYDVMQHLLNCEERLVSDPASLVHRIADLVRLDRDRILFWLFARCVLESSDSPALLEVAHRLRPV
jgi:streptomycin 6-kinase